MSDHSKFWVSIRPESARGASERSRDADSATPVLQWVALDISDSKPTAPVRLHGRPWAPATPWPFTNSPCPIKFTSNSR
ncbi:unnamed protein product, partial [Nesidiocoris tenuis]